MFILNVAMVKRLLLVIMIFLSNWISRQMLKYIHTVVFLILGFYTIAQKNMTLLSHVNYQQLHDANLNDVWGYVDETGKEYAIVGTSKGTSILDISDPTQPSEVFWIGGSKSTWRDPCVHGDFAYVTTEADDGLTIIDLSPLPGSHVLPTYNYNGTPNEPLLSAHTCYIDEKGIAYIFGSNRGNGGALMLDVHSDPTKPVEIGFFDKWYVHDGFVRNDTMYLAHVYDGFISLVDISDKANPVVLGTRNTPRNFSHNVWPSKDSRTVYTTDEVAGAEVTAYDIADPQNIRELDRFQNSPGSMPHNTHVRGDFLITSYYSDGVIINDITHPDNIIKVAEFDTYPGQTSGFNGAWGVYPFFPSGTIVASDITEGLFVLGVHYKKASYLEGIITNANSGLALSGAQIQISSDDHIEDSRNDGTYKTGILGVGNYSVTFSKVGYFSQTISIELTEGVIALKDVQLVPIQPYALAVNVFDYETSNPVMDANIVLQASIIEHAGVTNGLGQENLTLYYEANYNVTVGKWGYLTKCFQRDINSTAGVLNVYLVKGYYDDFSFDLGWQISGTVHKGVWERGRPNTTYSGSAPANDADLDCSDKAFVTGNAADLYPDADDVDGGSTVLTSPTMDLSSYSDPHINFSYWLYCFYGNPPDDTLEVFVNNGISTVAVAQLPPYESLFYQWNIRSIRLLDYILPTSSVTVSFSVSDDDPQVNITEAGIDYFNVTNGNVLGQNEATNHFSIYPNPFASYLFIESDDQEYRLVDLNGKLIRTGTISPEKTQIDLSNVLSGSYLIHCGSNIRLVIKD
jgi:choice-of-anchor B domain-containing protein